MATTTLFPDRLREPGLPTLPAGVERYRVRGGGACVFEMRPGDTLDVIDVEGRQPAEVTAFDHNGACKNALLGATKETPAFGLTQLATSRQDDAARVTAGLSRRGIRFDNARAIALFSQESPPGQRERLTAHAKTVCVLAAPGVPMQVDAQNPATELIALVTRVDPLTRDGCDLPEPLATPVDELRVEKCTARAFTVKAGQFIQIIDVEGRECSDFQAFSVASLEKDLEHCLDATTTRTLMGAAYPGPGLYSKFYDINMRPLIEVVRDTVGRHDTFGLACTAKYYDDAGYPGHVNCTENFNHALSAHGIGSRRGWEAINFFYNTGIDADNQLFLDEPWSRPGDYVLLRALTDLVCVSSACPDDIDAANAWNPTDIHVRVYAQKESFSKAVAYRMTPDADAELTKETAFHPRTSLLTRNISEYRGYWLPTHFTDHGAIEEYWACREAAIVTDLSPLRKFEVLGPDAEALLQYAVTRDVRRLSIGQVVYTAMCYETGGMLDDGTIMRLGADNFRWIGGDPYGGVWLRELAERKGLRAWVKSSTDELHNIAVQGPNSRDIMRDILWTPPTQPDIDELKWFRFCIARINNFDGIPLIVSRTGYTGELGYEVWCHPRHATQVWDAIWQAGASRGLKPLGLDALDMLRIEAGLIFANHEFCDQTDPFEAGISFAVAKNKQDDYVGKEALAKRRAEPQRTLVGLELAGEEAGAHGDCVHAGRKQVGIITSATRSPILAKNIALCRMDIQHAEVGTRVEIGKLDGHQKRIPASVVPFPFYDPEKLRVRS